MDLLWELREHKDWVISLELINTQNILVSGSNNAMIKLWSTMNG